MHPKQVDVWELVIELWQCGRLTAWCADDDGQAGGSGEVGLHDGGGAEP